jgi:hypothetical protein
LVFTTQCSQETTKRSGYPTTDLKGAVTFHQDTLYESRLEEFGEDGYFQADITYVERIENIPPFTIGKTYRVTIEEVE